MPHPRHILLIGATSAIAEHCARLWVQEGTPRLTLVGRSPERLEALATDLRVRNPQAEIHTQAGEFTDPAGIRATVDRLTAQGPIDLALIAHGSLPDQSLCQQDLQLAHATLEINGLSPALYAEALAGHFARQGYGTLGLIGSVAGDRGRRSNYVYGAAKGLLTRYAQGLQHRFAHSGVRVVLIKPGPTETPMTAGLEGRFAPVEDVARDIVRGMEKGQRVIYTPGKWRLIMCVIRHLPAFVFNRMNI
ncbi:MAG: SDR family NAD(P)-dependent oxidoreductase [Halothiobacillaceae bacterium]|jgi:short-subunit dehydrogenase|nr:SDR family NAD(P)-dependent oxidoreductase [Halothiobacillaceae bacterium]MDY0049836.1 SDR family NAD(P)-dependent oxidoreductase [Halothiobacillaceae bacterium]